MNCTWCAAEGNETSPIYDVPSNLCFRHYMEKREHDGS